MASLEHVIVLMLENNSFDRMLGALFPETVVGNNWDQETLYDLLGDNGISWKIYYGDGDISQTVVLRHSPWVDPMRYFFRDVQGPEAQFPKYCFIEPNYGTFPWDKVSQNDQHPLSDVFRGEKLIWD